MNNTNEKVTMLSGEALTRLIAEGIKRAEVGDAVEIRLPWFFGDRSASFDEVGFGKTHSGANAKGSHASAISSLSASNGASGGLGRGGEELVLTVRRVCLPYSSPQEFKQRYGKSTVDTNKYDEYIISDGGRAVRELEKRVGDISPYLPRIKRVVESTGMNTLRAGRIIEQAYSVYAPHRHLGALGSLLDAVTLVSNLDILPPYGSRSYSDDREKELAECAKIAKNANKA